MAISVLPAAPARLVDGEGLPQFGKFAGKVSAVDWSHLSGPYAHGAWWRRVHHKRWRHVALSTDAIFCNVSILDLGWSGAALSQVFERGSGALLASFEQEGLPGVTAQVGDQPFEGAVSHFSSGGRQVVFQHVPHSARFRLSVHDARFELAAELDAGAGTGGPPLLAVAPILHGAVHATQKSGGMALSGQLRLDGRVYELAGGVGWSDYANGFLARETHWQRASAHDMTLGFNLQKGYFGHSENALWLDGKLYALGNARFDYKPEQTLDAWHIYTEDGLLDLEFQPEGEYRHNHNMWLAASRYVQAAGSFIGWVRPYADGPTHDIDRLYGTAEVHFSRW